MTGLSAFCLTHLLPDIVEKKREWVTPLIKAEEARADITTARRVRAVDNEYDQKVIGDVAKFAGSAKTVLTAFGDPAKLTQPVKQEQPAKPEFSVSGITAVENGDSLVLAVSGTGLTGMKVVVPPAVVQVKGSTLALVTVAAAATKGLKQVVLENGDKALVVALPSDAVPAPQDGKVAPRGDIDATLVKKVQTALNRLKWKLEIDGKLGAKTVAALREFQKAERLPVTGDIDDATLLRLFVKAG